MTFSAAGSAASRSFRCPFQRSASRHRWLRSRVETIETISSLDRAIGVPVTCPSRWKFATIIPVRRFAFHRFGTRSGRFYSRGSRNAGRKEGRIDEEAEGEAKIKLAARIIRVF